MQWVVSPGSGFALEGKWGSFSSMKRIPFHQNVYQANEGDGGGDGKDDDGDGEDDEDNGNDCAQKANSLVDWAHWQATIPIL